jgi:large subunit ribosomal protein L4
MKLPVLNAEGKELRTLDVDETVFGIEPNQSVLHQAFVTQRNNQRAGTAQTKTRGQVQGSTRKTRMQKYTGRARHGGIRAPIFVGGGIAFGPQVRDFGQALNKKMRRLAIRSALSGKVADGELVVIDELTFKAPKTKEVIRILRNVGIQRSALIVTGEPDRTVLASARNLEKTKVLPAAYLNVADMLNHRHVLMTEEAVKVAEGLWGRKGPELVAPKEAPKAAPKRARAKAEAPAPAAETAVEESPKRRRAKAEAAPVEVVTAEAPVEAAAPKPRARRAAPTAKAAPAGEKPRTRARGAKPDVAEPEAAEKPKRPARRAKATAEAAPEEAPKTPRRRTKKSDAGE